MFSKLVVCPRVQMSIMGKTVAPGETATVYGADQIGMLGSQPAPHKYHYVAAFGDDPDEPKEIHYSDTVSWHPADSIEDAIAKSGADGATATPEGEDTERLQLIVDAISELGDDDYTHGGKPVVSALEAITDLSDISAAERDAAWAQYQAQE